VRIGLALKGVDYVYVAIDLSDQEQRSPTFRALNPQGLVPALEINGRFLTQSSAILEWLDETYPAQPFLPAALWDRALVRSMAALIGSDIQPLNNLRVQSHLRRELEADENAIRTWTHQWIGEGFEALERLVEQHGGAYCFGSTPTLADIYLAPQAATAERVGFDLTRFPRLQAVISHASVLPAFVAARPSAQPDWS